MELSALPSTSIVLDHALDSRPAKELLLAPFDSGARRRRGSDGVRLLLALLGFFVLVIAAKVGSHFEVRLVDLLTPVPIGLRWVVTGLWFFGTFVTTALVAGLGLAGAARAMLRDGLVATALSILGVVVARWLVGASVPNEQSVIDVGVSATFPVMMLTAAVSAQLAVTPYLSRPLQRTIRTVVTVTALAAVLHGTALATATAASILLSVAAVAAMHLCVGSPLGLPSVERVRRLLSGTGAEVGSLQPIASKHWGSVEFTGELNGAAVQVSVFGRDAAEAQWLSKIGRAFVFRDSGPSLAVSSLQQVEHEALVTLFAARTIGTRAPVVLAAGQIDGDSVLLTTPPAGQLLSELGDSVTGNEVIARNLLQTIVDLTETTTHGSLSPTTVVVDHDFSVGLIGFSRGTLTPTKDRADRDAAAGLALVALLLGAARAGALAHEIYGTDRLTRALPFLERAVLPKDLASATRREKGFLASVRSAGAAAAGVEPPELYEPRRVSWANLIMALGTVIGGWALLAVFVKVASSFSTLKSASWGFVALTFLFAQLCTVAVAATTVGSVIKPLPFIRAQLLEMSNAFSSLAAGNVGVLGTRVRFFQRQGYDATMAISSAVVSSTASWIAKGAALLIALPFALGDFTFSLSQNTGSSTSKLIHMALLVVAGVGIVAGLALFVPKLRRLAASKLRPKLDEATSHLKVLATRPSKLVLIFGGAFLAQLLVAFALGSALHAFGANLPLADLIVALTLGSMLGGLSPVPGGLGVVEAGMILALTAAGVPDAIAVSAVFVQRLFTSYLPPVWGWFTLVAMRRRDLL